MSAPATRFLKIAVTILTPMPQSLPQGVEGRVGFTALLPLGERVARRGVFISRGERGAPRFACHGGEGVSPIVNSKRVAQSLYLSNSAALNMVNIHFLLTGGSSVQGPVPRLWQGKGRRVSGTRDSALPRSERLRSTGPPACVAFPSQPGVAVPPPRFLFIIRNSRDQFTVHSL